MKAVVLISFLFCFGCSSVGPVPASGVSDRSIEDNRELFADADLIGMLEVEEPILERIGSSSLLKLTLPLRNVSGEDLQLLVQVEFLDSLGNSYNDDTGRRLLLLPRGSTKRFQATSMMAKASDYKVHMWRNR
jgi:hypothetical protein